MRNDAKSMSRVRLGVPASMSRVAPSAPGVGGCGPRAHQCRSPGACACSFAIGGCARSSDPATRYRANVPLTKRYVPFID